MSKRIMKKIRYVQLEPAAVILDSDVQPSNVKKRNVIEVKERKESTNTSARIFSSVSPSSPRLRSLHFNEALIKIIRPRNQSDRTSFRNITNWLVKECEQGRFNGQIFERVLDYAREAQEGGRNPAAVFTAILKSELGYGKTVIG